MKKKILSLAAVPVLALFGTLAAMPVSADETASADVTVTVADTGTLKVVNEPLTVTDTDGDGALTVNDVLYLIHEAKFEGGAAAGYATAETQWGLGITKLWGNENQGSFGYTVNNIFSSGLTDEVKAGDALYAYTYKDAGGYSDLYTYFDQTAVETEAGKAFTLTLKASTYDENWSPVQKPVEGAVITINGGQTSFVTGADGKAVITLDKAGDALISAVSEQAILVPAAAKVKVTEAATDAGSADITVTIANTGELVVVQEPVTVTDTDSDGKLTINDALYLIHEAKYEGGAAAGYATSETQWGLGLSKLWGNENQGSFGYTVNNTFANGLTDEVKAGDALYAYTYKDAAGYSDMFTYFDQAAVETEAGKAFTLTLTASTFDENWSPVQKPVEGAVITVDGEKTSFVTDADGKAVITLDKAGDAVISAVSEQAILVPAAAKVTVTEAQQPAQTDEPGQNGNTDGAGSQGGTQNVPAVQAGERAPIAVCVTALAMLGAAAFVRRKHEN